MDKELKWRDQYWGEEIKAKGFRMESRIRKKGYIMEDSDKR